MKKKTRKLKRPNGVLVEEMVFPFRHIFKDGLFVESGFDVSEADYTGRFSFNFFDDGGSYIKKTKWYTKNTAPKWLLAIYLEINPMAKG